MVSLITHEPKPAELRLCRDCRWSRPQVGGYGNDCQHQDVLNTHPDVLANWTAGRGDPFVPCSYERVRRRNGAACGVGAKLWERL